MNYVADQVLDCEGLFRTLSRSDEIAAAQKKGRKKRADVQMKMFDDCFREALGKPVPPNDVKLETQHFSFLGKNTSTASALDYQRAVLKPMKTAESDAGAAIREADPNDPIAQAVWHNHQQETATCQGIE